VKTSPFIRATIEDADGQRITRVIPARTSQQAQWWLARRYPDCKVIATD
jgi:hypothetical protein